MKKVGIFTYMLSNYGAVLQCYALQKYLSTNKFLDVEVIDFTTKEHIESASIFNHTISNKLVRTVYNFTILLHYTKLKQRKKRTEHFKRTNIKFSNRYDNMDDLLKNPPKEDYYITGSDQVFNLNSPYYNVYYLGFSKGKARKIAYAPSFGHCNFNENLWCKISSYIYDFDSLSCREKTGAEYLTYKTGKDVPVLVDPTLLLDKKEWTLVSVKPNYKKNYILIYDLNGGEKLVDIAREIKKIYDLEIICITNNVTKRYKVDKQVFDAGPGEFVGWIANATCVVTDSFHGTVFSIINRKPFYTYIAIPELATRIHTLLDICGQKNRIVLDDSIHTTEYSLEILFDTTLLDNTILQSKKYLRDSIF